MSIQSQKSKVEAETITYIKSMLEDLKSEVERINPDSLKVTISGCVSDTARFAELDQIILHGDVGFRKTKGLKTALSFNIKRDLTSYKKQKPL